MLSREDILARKAGVEKYTLADGSGDVGIKGVGHAQASEVSKAREDGEVSRATALIIAYGLVDPKMTVEEVEEWMTNDDAGTLEQLAQAIGRLSRLFEGAAKSGVSKPRRR